MEWQVRRLVKVLSGEDPWQGFTTAFPEVLETVAEICCETGAQTALLQRQFLDLYSRYTEEWLGFSARKNLTGQDACAA